jgi:hypothetical protein
MNRRCTWVVLIVATGMMLSTPATGASRTARDGLPRVFLDCQTWCYDDFLRSEVTVVDYVRDRAEADVHVQITRQRTGGGGYEYTLVLTGLGPFRDTTHRVHYVSPADDTQLGRRVGLAETLKVGLVPFLTQTSVASLLRVHVEPPEQHPQAERDPWNSWIMNVRGDGALELEQLQSEYQFRGGAGADRVTSEWKISLGLGGGRWERRIDVEDEEDGEIEEVLSVRTYAYLRGLVVKSLGEHWGVGGWSWTSSSSYANEDLEIGVAPGIEFNVFPYTDYARRELRTTFRLQFSRVRYIEETIFGKLEESLVRPRIAVNYEQRERWGTLGCELETSLYFHDPSRYRVQGELEASVRLVRGLSLEVNLEAARIRDQISLPARDATPEEILLRQRQIASGYEFEVWLGVRYTFGSIFNNVINPRFGD